MSAGLAACVGDPDPPTLAAPVEPPRFVELEPAQTGLAFVNELRPTEELNIITYLYYFNGGGIAAGDVDGDGLTDLYFTANQGPDALFINEGGMRFRENTARAGLSTRSDWSTGAAFVDIDGDGDLDLYVNKATGHAGLPDARNELYLNDGTGNFTEAAEDFRLDLQGLSTQTAFFDADADGDLDAYALRQSVHATGGYSRGGQRDRASGRYGDRLLIHGAGGAFVDESTERGVFSSRLGYGLGLAVADFDQDGNVDLAVGNDFREHDYLYLGLGGGRFAERGDFAFESTSKFSMGSAAADLNSDGRLDLITLDMRPELDSVRKSSSGADAPAAFASHLRQGFRPQYPRNAVQLNTPGGFVDVAPQLGVHSTDWSWAPVPFDGDLDGDLDLLVANGTPRRPNDLDYIKYSGGSAVQREASNLQLAALMPPGLARNRMFEQLEGGAFDEPPGGWGLAAYGTTTAALALDLDGDLDLDIVTSDAGGPARLYENLTLSAADADSVANVLTVEISGPPGNRFGVGASVVVRAPGFERVVPVEPVTGFQSSYLGPIQVALPRGREAAAATVEVRWPDGSRTLSLSGSAWRAISHADAQREANDRRGVESWAARTDAQTYDLRAYRSFDRDPLTPFVGALPMLGDSLPFAQSRDGARDVVRRWGGAAAIEAAEAAFPDGRLTAAVAWGDTLYAAGLWSPVVRFVREDGTVAATGEIAESGLWFSLTRVDDALVLGNFGTNTMLTERSGEGLRVFVGDYDRNGEAEPILVRGAGPEATTLFGLDALARQMPMMRKFFTAYLPFSASPFERLFGPMLERDTDFVLEVSDLRSQVYFPASGRLRALPAPAQRGALAAVGIAGDAVELRFAEVTAHPEIGNPSRRPVILDRASFRTTGHD